MNKSSRAFFFSVLFMIPFLGGISKNSYAASENEIQAQIKDTLGMLYSQSSDAHDVVSKAKGVLIFPGLWKAGIGLGGKYGEGALQINGETVDYYSAAGVSFGFQLGVQKERVILLFMDDQILNRFRAGDGWEAAIDGSVVLVKLGVQSSLNTLTHNEAIVTYVIGQRGLMYNLTFEGFKLTKIKK